MPLTHPIPPPFPSRKTGARGRERVYSAPASDELPNNRPGSPAVCVSGRTPALPELRSDSPTNSLNARFAVDLWHFPVTFEFSAIPIVEFRLFLGFSYPAGTAEV